MLLSLSLTAQRTDSQATETATATTADEDAESTTGGSLNTAEPISASEVTGSDGSVSTASATKTDFGQSPAGQVVMVTPGAYEGTALYKIGDYVTWGWNYTNLQADPTAGIDVILSCSVATQTWTLASNMSFETEGSFTWDSREQETDASQPLLTEMYTLVIADAEAGISATAEAGYLSPFSGFTFGMYAAQPYTPLSDWECAICNSAPGLDGGAAGLAVMVSTMTVVGFTWFVTGFGVAM